MKKYRVPESVVFAIGVFSGGCAMWVIQSVISICK